MSGMSGTSGTAKTEELVADEIKQLIIAFISDLKVLYAKQRLCIDGTFSLTLEELEYSLLASVYLPKKVSQGESTCEASSDIFAKDTSPIVSSD